MERERRNLARKQAEVEALQREVQAERESLLHQKQQADRERARMEADLKRSNEEALQELAGRVAKFKEAKELQESLLRDERAQLEQAAAALIAEKKAWKKKKKELKQQLL